MLLEKAVRVSNRTKETTNGGKSEAVVNSRQDRKLKKKRHIIMHAITNLTMQ
jgi:hypothetical protein